MALLEERGLVRSVKGLGAVVRELAPRRRIRRSTGPGGYLDRLEEAGHGPIAWTEFGRARMPSREEAVLLGISTAVGTSPPVSASPIEPALPMHVTRTQRARSVTQRA